MSNKTLLSSYKNRIETAQSGQCVNEEDHKREINLSCVCVCVRERESVCVCVSVSVCNFVNVLYV